VPGRDECCDRDTSNESEIQLFLRSFDELGRDGLRGTSNDPEVLLLFGPPDESGFGDAGRDVSRDFRNFLIQ
jgi:hypothetical protein